MGDVSSELRIALILSLYHFFLVQSHPWLRAVTVSEISLLCNLVHFPVVGCDIVLAEVLAKCRYSFIFCEPGILLFLFALSMSDQLSVITHIFSIF